MKQTKKPKNREAQELETARTILNIMGKGIETHSVVMSFVRRAAENYIANNMDRADFLFMAGVEWDKIIKDIKKMSKEGGKQ